MSLPHPRVAEPGDPVEPSDAELIGAVRAGDGDAYGWLYQRHLTAARRLAWQLSRSPAEVDDLVAEAFAKVLDTLRGGGGPDTAFRAYLLTTLRNTRYDRLRRDRHLELSDDMTRHDPGEPWIDTAVAGLESSLAARAFARLPERWQTVLWHTEVEQETPADLAPLLGLTPNGVAALAYRAREGLRQAYLREHLTHHDTDTPCGWTIDHLGAWTRHALSPRDHTKIEQHLATCPRCRPLATELHDVNSSLRTLIAPLILGPAAAAAYLTPHTATATATAGAAAAASAGGIGSATAGTGAAASAGEIGSAAAGTAAAAAGPAGAGTAATGTAASAATAGTTAGAATAGTTATGGAAGSTTAAGTAAGSATVSGATAGSAGAGTAAGGGSAGSAAAGSTAAGAGTAGSTAAGSAAAGSAGSAAAGTAAGGGAASGAAGGAGATGGSVLGNLTGWVAGTAAGKTTAAAVTALVLGGAAVGVDVLERSPADRPAAAAASAAAGSGRPAATEPGAAPVTGSGGASATSTVPTGSTPATAPGGSGLPGAPGGSGQPGTSPAPLPSGQPPAGPPALQVGPPAPVRPLIQGRPGEIGVPVHNSGTVPATNLVATVALPEGITVRAGGSNDPDDWACTGTGRVATCRVSVLPGTSSGTVRVKVQVAYGTLDGPVSGTVRADDGFGAEIPVTVVAVSPS